MSEYYRPANFGGCSVYEIQDGKIVVSFPDYYTDEDVQEVIDEIAAKNEGR